MQEQHDTLSNGRMTLGGRSDSHADNNVTLARPQLRSGTLMAFYRIAITGLVQQHISNET